ncbi:MAG: Xaa-Pro peptidase family protein [Candidatus Diapherotrites archaeon]
MIEGRKLKELFEEAKADSILLRNFPSFSDQNFYYFTGLYRESFANNFLVLSKNKKPLILTTKLEYGSIPKTKAYAAKIYDNEKQLNELLQKNLKAKRIGLNFNIYPVNSFKKLKKILKGKKFVDVSEELGKIRETKTGEEIKKIREAIKITREGIEKIKEKIMAGAKESDLVNELEYYFKKSGAEGTAFPSIIASGRNSAVPHYNTSSEKIKRNELILIDAGARFQGYCADITRNFVLGKASQKQKEVYEAVFRAQKNATEKIKNGVKAKELFNAGNAIIKKELNEELMHSLGHGLGIEVHDFPGKINDKAEWKLKQGMVLAIEPGFYDKRFGGIRIEDDLLVTKNSFTALSKSPKELIEL